MLMLKICKHIFYAYLLQIWKLTRFTRSNRIFFFTKVLLSGKFLFFSDFALQHLLDLTYQLRKNISTSTTSPFKVLPSTPKKKMQKCWFNCQFLSSFLIVFIVLSCFLFLVLAYLYLYLYFHFLFMVLACGKFEAGWFSARQHVQTNCCPSFPL